MTLEDTWGGDVVTAAIAHLAHSTPPEFLFTATDFNSYVTVSIADGAPRRTRGRMAAPAAPGLGVTLRPEVWESRCWSSAERPSQERDVLGCALLPAEIQHFADMARRIEAVEMTTIPRNS